MVGCDMTDGRDECGLPGDVSNLGPAAREDGTVMAGNDLLDPALPGHEAPGHGAPGYMEPGLMEPGHEAPGHEQPGQQAHEPAAPDPSTMDHGGLLAPSSPTTLAAPQDDGPVQPRPLTEADAIEIWIARWLRIRPKHLIARYGCASRRLYEIWWGDRFPGSRKKAEKLFRERYPAAVERTGFGYRRIPRVAEHDEARQMSLFK
jgi:hypothetical protein